MPVKHRKDLWEKPPHTEMKHEILRRYLQAWLPILSGQNPHVIIIDGFAGPGEYIDPNNPDNRLPGSPLIIVDTIESHKLKGRFGKITLLFVEDNKHYSQNLIRLLSQRQLTQDKRIKWHVIESKFAPTITQILDQIETQNACLPPCFAFIDPFGPRGLPMQLIGRLMKHRYSEVLINYLYDPTNRHLGEPKYEIVLDEFFGCPEWREIRKEQNLNPKVRCERLLNLYLQQLSTLGRATYTVPFEMRDRNNRALCFLVFGTKHVRGLDLMKQAMWQIAPEGNFQFSDYIHNKYKDQLPLFPTKPDYDELSQLLWDHFNGQKVNMQEIADWVVVETRYCTTHIRRALQLLEDRGQIRKWDGEKLYERKHFFPERISVEFLHSL